MLSTCNRTEVYAVAERFHGAYQDIRDFLAEVAFLAPEDFSDHLYVHYDAPAVAHLFARGRRARLGRARRERDPRPGQARRWERARQEGAAGPGAQPAVPPRPRGRQAGPHRHRHRPQHHLGVAGRRGDGRRAPRRPRRARAVLVLGAGEMGEAMALGLAKAGAPSSSSPTAPGTRAVELADRVGGRAVRLLDVPAALADVDVLLTSTGAAAAAARGRTTSRQSSRARAGRPLLIVDIAVPRDVDPAVGAPARRHAARHGRPARLRRRRHARPAQGEVAGVQAHPRRGARALPRRHLGPRGRADDRRAARPGRGGAPGRARALPHPARRRSTTASSTRSRRSPAGIIGKLLHEPSVALKDAAGSTRGDRLVAALRELFALDDDDTAPPP